MADWIFDVPVWIVAGLLALAAGALWQYNLRREKNLLKIALGLLAGALLWWLLSVLIDTDREQVEDRIHQLVRAMETRDWAALPRLLDVQVSLDPIRGREGFLAAARSATENFKLQSARIQSLNLRRESSWISVELTVVTQHEQFGGRPFISRWRLDWYPSSEGWRLTFVEPMDSLMLGRDQIHTGLQRLPPPR